MQTKQVLFSVDIPMTEVFQMQDAPIEAAEGGIEKHQMLLMASHLLFFSL